MKPYTHLSEKERDRIAVLHSRGHTLREIARALGRHFSSLSRELSRNRSKRYGYLPHKAQEHALNRRQNHKRMRLKSRVLRQEVERLLALEWSPEIIANRLPRERPELPPISHEAIYQWIYSEAPHLVGYLIRSHRRRRPRRWNRKRRFFFSAPRVSIKDRPALVNSRQQFGHWETDLLIGKGRSAIQVAVERKARYTRLQKVPAKTASVCRLALHKTLAPLPPHLRRSVTYDNGSENADHFQLNVELGMDSFFCEPYHSWEKGSVENRNGVIRRFLPKRTDFDTISDEKIRAIESWLNNRPMKCLGFQTPAEVLSSFVALQG